MAKRGLQTGARISGSEAPVGAAPRGGGDTREARELPALTPPASRRERGRRRSADAGGETSRAISPTTTAMLWGRAAGRCEFEGCNRPLYLVDVTQEVMNVAQRAHIRPFSDGGPRARETSAGERVHDIDNLMLLCPDHHVRIDKGDGPERYPETDLREMKRRHEERVHIATGIAPSMSSHVLFYGAHVGAHAALPAFDDAARALFPHRYPAERHAAELGSRTSGFRDRDAAFWDTERAQLHRQFELQVRTRRAHAEVGHLSVFAIAPQPLLIDLGVLLGDMTDVDVFQLHREPRGWTWPAEHDAPSFVIEVPEKPVGIPVLVLAVSASITLDRITRVLGELIAPYIITLPSPHNDVLKARSMVAAFRSTMRRLLAQIRAAHGDAVVHVFPALPVALAVELGRVRIPKADAPWLIYDQQGHERGFVPTITIAEASL